MAAEAGAVTVAPLAGLRLRAYGLSLAALLAVPLLAVVWGHAEGGAFVAYREPKRAVMLALGWTYLAFFWGCRDTRPSAGGLATTLARLPWSALVGFVLWSGLTRAWTLVPANHLYEAEQYLLVTALFISLAASQRRGDGWRQAVEDGLCAAGGLLTVVGLLQVLGLFSWLAPIDPELGGRASSLMGYKNPAAHLVAAQLLLVARRVSAGWPWILLFMAEVAYLGMLRSRTAYAAVACGSLVLLVLSLMRKGGQRRLRSGTVMALLLLLGTFATTALVHAPTRQRLAETVSFVRSPAEYLATDRGVYLRNTLHMVSLRPLGVGLGDWQTQYPVYRLHDRYRAFDATHQVRRAHADHVQILGETGWPGLALWALVWLGGLGVGARAALRGAGHATAFRVAQLAVVVFAMGFDYVVEVPYLKLVAFAVLFLASPGAGGDVRTPASGRWHRPLVAMLAVLALVSGATAVAATIKAHRAAAVESAYRRAVAATDAHQRRALLGLVARRGRSFAALPAHDKTHFRVWGMYAQSLLAGGDPERAAAAAERALELHPHSTDVLALLGRIERARGRPAVAAQWERAAHEILHEATAGPPAMPGMPAVR